MNTSTTAVIWSITNQLQGYCDPADYDKVIIPFVFLRRIDCALEPGWTAVLDAFENRKDEGEDALDPILKRASGRDFYNTSPFPLSVLLQDQENIRVNLERYVEGLSPNVRAVFGKYAFSEQISRLEEAGLLFQVVEHFTLLDLHSNTVSNAEMGQIFEELMNKLAGIDSVTIARCCLL